MPIISRQKVVENAIMRITVVLFASILMVRCQSQPLIDQDFSPTVTATCKGPIMTIRVNTNQPFYGAVHARDYRKPDCMTIGNGTIATVLEIPLLASPGAPDYCGVIINNRTEEKSISVAVRIHRTLELADDKSYVITCGKAGFKNARNEKSLVSLKLIENGKRIQEVIYGRSYTLRADISRPDGKYGIRVKSCFAFSKKNDSVPLIDDRGCPERPIISQFTYNEEEGTADATLYSMFRFEDSKEVHFQCDIALCKDGCPPVTCEGAEPLPSAQARALPTDIRNEEDGVVMASTSVFVLEPGEAITALASCDGGVRPPWLLYLCIALGILLLIMLIINIFLCTAMTCSCTRTEVIEKEPSIIEDYDPYRSWHGSQYGSRYSLNGKPGYTSAGSTMNSTRSMSTNSDHYAIVHSRPGSRYSGPGSNKGNGPPRGPPSAIGSHYSGKM